MAFDFFGSEPPEGAVYRVVGWLLACVFGGGAVVAWLVAQADGADESVVAGATKIGLAFAALFLVTLGALWLVGRVLDS